MCLHLNLLANNNLGESLKTRALVCVRVLSTHLKPSPSLHQVPP